MAHPTEVTEAWQALAEASDADRPSDQTTALLGWLEEGGYQVHLTNGAIFIDQPAGPDHETHQSSRDAAWRIEQVA